IESGREPHLGVERPVYEFRHLSFQEYLAARALIDGCFPLRNPTQSIAEQIAPLAGRTADARGNETRFVETTIVESWREALRLCTAICKNDDVDRILRAILLEVPGESAPTRRARAIQAA